MFSNSYAKINLALNVVNKTKPKNLHDLDMLNVTISLKDQIFMSFKKDSQSRILISCNNEKIPTDSANLVYKVIEKFQKNFNVKDSVSIKLIKNIPMEAGLGGGSSNAATTLDMLNRKYKTNMTVQQRVKFLEDISSDAPFLEVGQLSRVKGTGNKIEPLNISAKYKVLVVKPKSGCSTKEIYGSIDYKTLKHYNINKAVNALEKKDLKAFNEAAGNSLLEPAIKNNPDLIDVLQRLQACEFDYVGLSGSGSACFAISKTGRAYKVAKELLNKNNYELMGVYSIKNYRF